MRAFSKKTAILLSIALALLILTSFITLYKFGATESTNSTVGESVGGKRMLRIATTTSLDATGLLDAIKKAFEQKNPNVNVTWVAVGTGQAVAIGKRGDVDLIIVHNRPLEDEFIREGYGVHGITFAQNDFILLGPGADPANVNSSKDVVDAFRKIYDAGEKGKALFISRGDRSGTHLRELDIWKAASLNITGKSWYIEAGQGMGQTLTMAGEKQAYTLSDRSTYLSMKNSLSLKIVFEGDPLLLNLYRAIIVNPEKFPSVQYDVAEKFVLFIVSNEGQNLIGNYTKGGQRLFNPAFGRLNQWGISDPYEEEQVAYWKNRLQK